MIAIDGATRRDVVLDDVTLSVHDAGSGPAVVLCHGFPELAYSWRRQIPVLAAAGYRVLAPDQRGYGDSSVPAEVTAYDMTHLCGDLVGLLDALEIDRAVFVGHDWGGLVVWQMPLRHPDRVAGVVGVNTPYLPRLPIAPTEAFRMLAGDDHYILWFQEPGVADEVLARDIPQLFSSLMRTGVSPEQVAAATEAMADPAADSAGLSVFEKLMGGPKLGHPLLAPDELAVYVEAFGRTGFTGGLNWYRNFDRNWETTPEQDGARIDDVPCLMITAEWDPVLVPALAEGMDGFIDDLELRQIDRCGHWTPTERPADLDALLVDWLTRKIPR